MPLLMLEFVLVGGLHNHMILAPPYTFYVENLQFYPITEKKPFKPSVPLVLVANRHSP
jgi:hypothetical protein